MARKRDNQSKCDTRATKLNYWRIRTRVGWHWAMMGLCWNEDAMCPGRRSLVSWSSWVKSSFLDVFIKWNEQDKQLIIENARITSADRTRNELFGKYTIAKFKEQKNRAFLDEEDFDDNLVSSADQGWWIKRRDSKSKPKLLNSYSINWHLLQAFSFSINCSFKLFKVYMRIMVFSFVVIDLAHKSITLLYV